MYVFLPELQRPSFIAVFWWSYSHQSAFLDIFVAVLLLMFSFFQTSSCIFPEQSLSCHVSQLSFSSAFLHFCFSLAANLYTYISTDVVSALCFYKSFFICLFYSWCFLFRLFIRDNPHFFLRSFLCCLFLPNSFHHLSGRFFLAVFFATFLSGFHSSFPVLSGLLVLTQCFSPACALHAFSDIFSLLLLCHCPLLCVSFCISFILFFLPSNFVALYMVLFSYIHLFIPMYMS